MILRVPTQAYIERIVKQRETGDFDNCYQKEKKTPFYSVAVNYRPKDYKIIKISTLT